MSEPPTDSRPSERYWYNKFANALHGTRLGIRGQHSFRVHFATAAAAVVCGAALGVSRHEWYMLLLCITVVLAAEMFNSALESMARAITHEHNPHLGGALDIGSAAVLVASVGAALIGLLIFTRQLLVLLGWWGG